MNILKYWLGKKDKTRIAKELSIQFAISAFGERVRQSLQSPAMQPLHWAAIALLVVACGCQEELGVEPLGIGWSQCTEQNAAARVVVELIAEGGGLATVPYHFRIGGEDADGVPLAYSTGIVGEDIEYRCEVFYLGQSGSTMSFDVGVSAHGGVSGSSAIGSVVELPIGKQVELVLGRGIVVRARWEEL